MADTEVYRIVNYATGVSTPHMSVVSNGVKTAFVYPGKTEYSTDSSSSMYRIAMEGDTPPESVQDWLRIALTGGTYLGSEDVMVDPDLSFDVRVGQEETYYDAQATVKTSPGKDRELSDNISELLINDEELNEFFTTGSATEEPEGMRDFVRLLLESENALQYNPGLIPWLEGGDPPSDQMFDGLVFWPEEGNTNG